MPQPGMLMSRITEVLHLENDARLSHTWIARAIGLSRGEVGKYVPPVTAAGISVWPLPDGTDQASFGRGLVRASPSTP